MGRTDERPAMDDVGTTSRGPKPTQRRLQSDMALFKPAPDASSPVTREASRAFWDTVLNNNNPGSHRSSSGTASRFRTSGQSGDHRPEFKDHHAHHRHQQQTSSSLHFHHSHSADRDISSVYRCGECDAVYESSLELNTHKAAHHPRQPRPHKCERCSMCFSQRSHLNQHVRTVHDKHKPFQCEKCDKSFGKRFDLTSHCDAVHGNERPHACRHCRKAFAKRSNLTRHVEKLHPRYVPSSSVEQRRRAPL